MCILVFKKIPLKKPTRKVCVLNPLASEVYHIMYLFSLFLTPLFQGSGYPDAKYSCKITEQK